MGYELHPFRDKLHVIMDVRESLKDKGKEWKSGPMVEVYDQSRTPHNQHL